MAGRNDHVDLLGRQLERSLDRVERRGTLRIKLIETDPDTSSAEKLLIKVQEFIVHRMPEEAADRVALREWAEAELTKLEERAPGGGVTKIGTAPIAKTGRRMSMLRTVMREIEVFDAPAGAGHAA